jgi:hypothetical protein
VSDGGTVTSLPGPRYVVTELVGYLEMTPTHRHGSERPGAAGCSFHVIDRWCNHRLLGIYRSEDYGRLDGRFCSTATRIAYARRMAEQHVHRLSGASPTPAPRFTANRFRPTCPRCGERQAHDADYCLECGCALYVQARRRG